MIDYCSSHKKNKLIKLENKWIDYKRLRSYDLKCKHGHPQFMTMQQREGMLNKLFLMIFGKDE